MNVAMCQDEAGKFLGHRSVYVEGLSRVLEGGEPRTYGYATLGATKWQIAGEPQMLMMFKRMFKATRGQHGSLMVDHTPGNAELLEWFLLRYPLKISEKSGAMLKAKADEARRMRAAGDEVLRGTAPPMIISTKLPLRHYQEQGVQLLSVRNVLLCGDDLGLGKTAIALGAMAVGLLPAIVVCKTHLQQQWVNEAAKFLDGVVPHVVKKGSFYPLPAHNLLVITYTKMRGWADHLKGYQLIAFDEMQELRRSESDKYQAAKYLCEVVPNRLGLTATPVYNYGDEIFNIINLMAPGELGSDFEFYREWCEPIGNGHHRVLEPSALGAHLAEQHLFLRRRRAEVGRELPPVTKVTEEVEYNTAELLKNEDRALELAQTVLKGEWTERGKAALELDAMLRLQTGLAKAPFVAEFVRQLVESGEQVVLCGWHREVYMVWQRAFDAARINYALYTGSESPNQKSASVQAFLNGDANVLILSLRSGEGLNGLQEKCNVIVFGELDWSPQVHDQCIGRLNRDGQANPVTAVYLHAGGGSDPVVMQVLGVKRSQSEGIINPHDEPNAVIDQQAMEPRVTELAKRLLKGVKGAAVEATDFSPATPF